MRWLLNLLLALAVPCPLAAQAANDFSTDSNVKALYLCEASPGVTGDSKSTNTLTDNGAGTSETAKQGSQSCDFEASGGGDLRRADASLTSGFPGKRDDATKIVSVSLWFRPESLPTSGNRMFLVAKYDSDNDKRSWRIGIFHNGTSPVLEGVIGYGTTGTAAETTTISGAALSTATWYHGTFTYNNGTKAYALRLRDASCATLGSDSTGTFRLDRNGMAVSDVDFSVGASGIGAYLFDGLEDEVVIANDVLTSTESDQICKGTYTGGAAAIPRTRMPMGMGS